MELLNAVKTTELIIIKHVIINANTYFLDEQSLESTEQILSVSYKGKRLPRAAPFEKLPDQLIVKILSFLPTASLCLVSTETIEIFSAQLIACTLYILKYLLSHFNVRYNAYISNKNIFLPIPWYTCLALSNEKHTTPNITGTLVFSTMR